MIWTPEYEERLRVQLLIESEAPPAPPDNQQTVLSRVEEEPSALEENSLVIWELNGQVKMKSVNVDSGRTNQQNYGKSLPVERCRPASRTGPREARSAKLLRKIVNSGPTLDPGWTLLPGMRLDRSTRKVKIPIWKSIGITMYAESNNLGIKET